MAINLLNLKPHKVSTDLSGYMIYLYGCGGAGKTTFGSKAEKPLLLAFEKGYNAIPGIIAQDIRTWSEMRQVMRELKKPEVKEMFKTIVVDTVDIASSLCEKYTCSQLGIENIGDGGWTINGWSKVKKEWESVMREISMQGYALIFISHSKEKKFTRKDGTEYTQIVPSCSNAYNEIIRNMVDIQGYINVDQNERHLILRSADDTVECKCHFAEIDPIIEFSFDSLSQALTKAINSEAEKTNGKYMTTEKAEYTPVKKYDYDAMMTEFNTLVSKLMETDAAGNGPKITAIVNKTLGRGKKFSECTPDRVEVMEVVLDDIKAEFGL